MAYLFEVVKMLVHLILLVHYLNEEIALLRKEPFLGEVTLSQLLQAKVLVLDLLLC